MKPLIHAKSSARKYGGTFEAYLPIHDFMDSTKAALPDVRHRAILHSAFGIFIVERVFGTFIVNSVGKQVSVRDIAEDHVLEDLGFIPTVEKWFETMPIEAWMGGKSRKTRKIAMEDMGRDPDANAAQEVEDAAPVPQEPTPETPAATPPSDQQEAARILQDLLDKSKHTMVPTPAYPPYIDPFFGPRPFDTIVVD